MSPDETHDDTQEFSPAPGDADGEEGGVFDGHQHLDDETPEEVGAPAGSAAEGDSPEDVGAAEDAPHDEAGSEDAPLDEGEDASSDEDSELDELISAETQEWEAVEAAEDEEEEEEDEAEADEAEQVEEEPEEPAEPVKDEEPTLVGAAGQRLGEGVAMVREWRPGFPLWLRFLSASVVIIFTVAAAVSASLILYLGDVAAKLRDPSGVLQGSQKFLTNVDGGAPQTILILGSDKDPELKDELKGFRGLSDTTMLLRLDPDREAIALFSLPRDLRVSIPGYGVAKLNEAYAEGGPELTLRTVEQLLSIGGQEFEVNHLVNVNFEGFARAVNALDCVYVDVDRRYFNSNEGKAAQFTYEEIDLQPGYQALCGFDALDYARYRHTDNDIVRAARQQEFLREARQKIPPERLFSERKELISIFTEHTTSDIDDPQTMLQVLKLFLESRDAPIKQVKFEGNLGPSFVTTTTAQLQKAVNQFFGIQATPGLAGQTAAPDQPVEQEEAPDKVPVRPEDGGGKGGEEPARGGTPPGLTETDYGEELARSIRARVANLTVYYPTLLETGSDYDQKPRVYKVNGTGEGAPPTGERAAYKWVFSRPALGEYYGFMATRWKDPPILEGPDDARTIGNREYRFYYDGDRLRMVAWEDDLGSYWVTNTLIESLSNEEMLEIAKGMRELPRRGG